MMEGLCFYSSKYRVTKGFKFHAQPQTGAYSCFLYELNVSSYIKNPIRFVIHCSTYESYDVHESKLLARFDPLPRFSRTIERARRVHITKGNSVVRKNH